MRDSYVRTALLAVTAVCSGISIFAQATSSATLLGTVTDKTGAVVPNAAVNATETQTGLTRASKTAGNGLYRFDLLPAGIYTVDVTAAGFAKSTFEKVSVQVGQTTTIDASLSPSSQSETITVEAGSAGVVDTERTDISRPITPEEIQDLPLNGRDFANLAYLAPGVKPADSYDPTKNRYAVFSVNGSSGRNVNVTVNGIDNKDNTVGGPVMQLPLEAVQEFLISTQRFSAANGRSEGAAINTITKSGTNDLHGSLYFFDRSDVFNANDYFSQQGGNDKPPYSRQQFGGSVGGPVRRDKDFLFFALEREREQTNLVTNPDAFKELSLVTNLGAKPAANIPTPYYDWRYNGRYDHRFNNNHSLFLSYTAQNNDSLNDQSGQQNDLTEGNFTTNHLIIANATFNSVLTPSIVNSFTAGYQYWNNLIDSSIRAPFVTFPSGATFGTNANVPQQSYQTKWQFKDDMSITRGAHSFKFGFDFLWEPKLGGFFEFNPTPEVDFIANPSTILSDKAKFPQGFATPGAVIGIAETAGDPYEDLPGGAKQFGLYFQDDWKVNRRLTVNLGLRWDKDYNLIAGSTQLKSRTYDYLRAIKSPYAAGPHDDSLDLSPRVGFAWDVTGSGKSIVRGGFGIYYGQTFLNIPLFMIQQTNPTLFATVVSLSSAGPGDPNADIVPGVGIPLSQWRYGVDPLPPNPGGAANFLGGEVGRLMDPHYHNPYTEQWNGGYSYAINSNNVVEAEYVHVLSLRESKTIDINPKLPNVGGTRLLNPLFVAAGLHSLARVDDEQSIGRSRYDGMNISYRRRMTHHVTLNANYSLSRSVAYNGPAASFRNRPTDINNIFSKPDFGPTPSDERHHVTLSGLVELPWGIHVAPIIQGGSSRPYNTAQGIDVFGYGRNNAHAILLKSDPKNYLATIGQSAAQLRGCLAAGDCFEAPFDSLRGSPFFQWDMRVSKVLRWKEKYNLELMFQAFNLTNRANFGNNYDGTITSSTFGKPIGYINPSSTILPRSFNGEFGATFRF